MSQWKPLDPALNLPVLEKQIIHDWEEREVFKASLGARENAPRFVYFEGPPTANGSPGTHHILARAFKDLIGRYKTMKGFYVERKAGWDCHGLPVELEIEKKLGISGKKAIEEYGIAEFNQLCAQSVTQYVSQWEEFSKRMGHWQDYENAYSTMDSSYIESVWWALGQMWQKGLIYEGFRVAPYCPRCATPLSSHELSLGYIDNVKAVSVFIRFRLKADAKTSFLAWTTTPWTLPGNVALAVGEDIDYVQVHLKGEDLILAKECLGVLESDYEVVKEFTGRDLLGMEYESQYEYLVPQGKAFLVVAGNFVSTKEGTGIVHLAPAYGADDLRVAQENHLPVRHVVDLKGCFVEEMGKFASVEVDASLGLILADLKEKSLLFRTKNITHTYPSCWRCSKSLIYYALNSWYVKTSSLGSELLNANQETVWQPAHVQKGRMGDWLSNNVDWAISRSRYWGTPLPFWRCSDCGKLRVISSRQELGVSADFDLHRPMIDDVVLTCECHGEMRRVSEVLDCWFDSGSMPFAQHHFPKANAVLFEESFPADFICEAVDQTRGWFYSLMAISVALFEKNAYKNVVCLGHVVDKTGKKLSKSRGNAIDPDVLFDQYGADVVRWYFFSASSAGENYLITDDALKGITRRLFLPLWNVASFFLSFASVESYKPSQRVSTHVLDRWLLSRLSATTGTVEAALDKYEIPVAARALESFVDELSRWYLRRSRERFTIVSSPQERQDAFATLYYVLQVLCRLMAPFAPFFSERIYSMLAPNSVHLADWPTVQSRDLSLEAEMNLCMEYTELVLSERDRLKIKVRQPLQKVVLPKKAISKEVAQLLLGETNIHEVEFGSNGFILDTKVTSELEKEMLARELVRSLNAARKKMGLSVGELATLYFHTSGRLLDVITTHAEYIRPHTYSVALLQSNLEGRMEKLEVEGEDFHFYLRLISL